MSDQQQRTEQPTGRRLQKARDSGQFLTSPQLVAAAQFTVFVTICMSHFTGWMQDTKVLFRTGLVAAFHTNVNMETLPMLASQLVTKSLLPILLLSGLSAACTMGLHMAITKGGFSSARLTPDITRLNPASKFKSMFEQGPVSTLQAAAMLVIFSAAIYSIAIQNAETFLSIPFASMKVGLAQAGAALKSILWKAIGIFILFGAVDLIRQKRIFMKSMKMTKEEVRRENKDNEGSPHVKSKIRQMQRDMARRRMMKEVATATAVIVNPTHYAVALRYNHDTMATPVVVAKAKNYLALRIRAIATENGVPLVENKPLAQALYKSVDVGREIPPHLYRAVAEVLAYIYKITRGRG